MSNDQVQAGAPPTPAEGDSSWWPPIATFFTVLVALFFGLIAFSADKSRAPDVLQSAPVWCVAAVALFVAFVAAFVVAPWKRIHVSFGPPGNGRPDINRAKAGINDAMVAQIRDLFATSQYHAILRRARWFSRYLWLENCIDQRIEVGEIVRQAALRVNDQGAEAAALIDDLGWSLVVKQRFGDARGHIDGGITAARKAKQPYWVARGYRHLAGLKIELGEYDEAYEELDRAHDAAAQIATNDRDEMLASIMYGRALCALRACEYPRCAAFIAAAEELAPQLAIRSHFLTGMVLIREGKVGEAEVEFQRGIAAAANEGDREEEIQNRRGLVEVHLSRGDTRSAHREQAEVARIQSETPAPYEHSDAVLTRWTNDER